MSMNVIPKASPMTIHEGRSYATPSLRVCLVFMILASFVSVRADTIEIPLEYVRHVDERGAFEPKGYDIVSMKFDPPRGDWVLPELVGPNPLYGTARIGGQKRLFILSRQNEEDVFYNRLHFDANGNGDLTDNPVIEGKLEQRRDRDSVSVSFPPVDMHVTHRDQQIPYSFLASMQMWRFSQLQTMSKREQERMLRLMVRPHCHYEGAFTLDDKTYRFALSDANVNGLFDDILSAQRSTITVDGVERLLPQRPDTFFLSEGDRISRHDWLHLGRYLVLDNRVFEVNLDAAREILTLTEITDGLASLPLAAQAEQLTLMARDSGVGVMARQPGAVMPVPEDAYRMVACRIIRADEWGDQWVIRGEGNDDASFIAATPDAETALVFGDPLVGSVVGMQARHGTTYRLSFRLRGAGDERITEVTRISGTATEIPISTRRRNHPEEPTYQIVRLDGTVVASGQLDYG